MIKLGLVTVLFKSDEVLPDFFASIALQSYTNYILYLIDNSPSETTRLVISQLKKQYNFINLVYIENEKNIGVAAGNNIGIKQAFIDGCDDLIILNNDIVFNDVDTFLNLVKIAEANIADIIAPKVYYFNTNKLWYAGGAYLKWKGSVKHFGDKQEDSGEYNVPKYVSYAPTCFAYIKGNVFKKTGLMDETYFVYSDDLDFMYRALRLGFRLYYIPTPFILHKISNSTGGATSGFSVYYIIRNRVFFVRKFGEWYVKPFALFYIWLSLSILLLLSPSRSLIQRLNTGFIDGFKLK